MKTYFEKLRTSGNKIDADIKKLEKIWESPMLFISAGYGENIEEASPYIETFLGTLKGIQDELIENLEFRTKRINSTDNLLSDVNKFYTDLKQQYKEIETLLSESGYQPSPESTEQYSTTESETESSILNPEQMGDTTSSSLFLSPGGDEISDRFVTLRNEPKSIPTPVIKSLASVTRTKII